MLRLELLKRLLLLLLGFVTLYGVMVLLLRWIGLENAQQLVRQSGHWAPVSFVILCAFSLIIAPLSGSSLFIAGGAIFGKQSGFLLSLLATVLGCSANFWISRKFGRNVVARLIGKASLAELDQLTGRVTGNRGIFYLTLLMPLSQDIVSYAAGLTPISYSRFAIALILSGTVIVAAYIYLGSSLLEVLL
ncbi:MAG: VTT domain-containing protein [Pegethrix bostrychoides GSE-TBD4-15B]|uniref:TVP38/TMEM64 family membrane protein n=1 Tax=Pegethrix bostrychoides GSE-TBD4-15B TaxID=2839662 RepID=A0A951PC82_9CYAN|nr:VTT domain-containing protein [Pegethrix bostrychoides GSE-TBD4-15B]